MYFFSIASCVVAGAVTIEIESLEDLKKIGNDPGYPLDGTYALINDIDASDTVNWNGGAGWILIGIDPGNPFCGTFDGQGHAITGLFMNSLDPDHGGGLFGSVTGTVKNLRVLDVNITAPNTVGAVARGVTGSLINCHSSGVVCAYNCAGGLVGVNPESFRDTFLSRCSSSCKVVLRYGSSIPVFGGGLVGSSSADIEECFATGSVIIPKQGAFYIGGLVGHFGEEVSLSRSYATGAVSGAFDVGGLVGLNYGTVDNCYSTGAVTGDDKVGGLVGENYGALVACYATGFVTGDMNTGGLLGWNANRVSFCYWNCFTSGQEDSNGGEGRTTDDMTWPYAVNTFTGWDFETVWAADEEHFINDGYPCLIQNAPILAHPADINKDFRVVLSEAIAYLTGWQQGSNPMAYAIRAAYVWQNGEHYTYDSEEVPPVCWVLGP